MLALTMPDAAVDDDTRLAEVCANPLFAPHLAVWQTRYVLYRRRRGNEFRITAFPFGKTVHDRQEALYRNRKDNATFRAIRETVVVCCPMCGSPGTGDLDHHLPEGRFGEFAIMIANLVPSCGHCNSGVKRAAGIGAAWPERFLHPYYDRFASKPLWWVRVTDPVVPRFVPEPERALKPRLARLMAYNLAGLLGWQFRNHLTSYWTKLPVLLKCMVGAGVMATDQQLDDLFQSQYMAVSITEGVNGWKAALIRGIRGDPVVRLHLAAAAAVLPNPV